MFCKSCPLPTVRVNGGELGPARIRKQTFGLSPSDPTKCGLQSLDANWIRTSHGNVPRLQFPSDFGLSKVEP